VSNIIYLDGQYLPREEAKISVYDHGLLYGDGIFEGIRIYNGRIFKLEEHIKRLYESARSICLNIPLTKEEMAAAHIETARRNGLRDAYVRTIVTRGVGNLGVDPRKCDQPTVIIIVDKISLYPPEMYEKGLDCATVATRRNMVDTSTAQVKSLNYMNSVMGKIDTWKSGAFEGIMLDRNGYVTEATADNVFIIKDGELLTPPVYLGILNGITRSTVLELAKKLGIPAREAVFTRHDLYTADECFLTGSGAEVIPVINIDMRDIGTGKPGEITWRLIRAYRELVNSTGTSFGL
jgi:branched-chain amino acid aminotransferase